MNHKPEPDTTLDHAPWSASPPRGAQLDGGAHTTELKLFNPGQTTYTTDDYYTPRWIFDAMGITFDLDVACPPFGPVNVPATNYYTQTDDGLTQPWYGRVWMNPPYSKPSPWVERWLNHANGIALLPYSKSKWLQTLWDSNAALVYIYSLKFERVDKRMNGSTPFPLGIWAIGDDNIKAIAKLGRVR